MQSEIAQSSQAPSPVDAFVARLDPPLREIVEVLRRLARHAAPGAEEVIKWGTPCYRQSGLVCSIAPARGYARLQFFRGTDALLPDALEALVKGAVRLNGAS